MTGAKTVAFAFDGVTYEIDLSPDNRAKLEAALGPFVGAARKIGGKPKLSSKKEKKTGAGAKIRKWAAENGFKVSSRGRIPAEVRAAYNHANPH